MYYLRGGVNIYFADTMYYYKEKAIVEHISIFYLSVKMSLYVNNMSINVNAIDLILLNDILMLSI